MAASIDTVIAYLQDLADDALRSARETTSRIQYGVAPAIRDPELDYDPNKPNLGPPPTFADLFPGDTTNETIKYLDNEVEEWIDKYFPELNACLRSTPEEWLCGILTGSKPFGLDKAVFDTVWNEGRDRAYRAANTEVKTLEAEFSNRGFSLPPGTMVDMVIQAEQRASQAIADINRTETVRAAEIKLDLLKFAEEQAIKLKLGIMDALRQFYVAWMQVPDKDIEKARIRAQAQASLYAALSSYYNVELGFEELRLRAAQADVAAILDVDKNKIAAFSSNRAADALANAVRGFSDVSAAAANAGSTLVAQISTGA